MTVSVSDGLDQLVRERQLELLGATVRGAPLWSHGDIAANGKAARYVIIGAVEPFDAPALDRMPVLAAVVRRGVGVDNVDVDAATERGIIVANVPDASVEEVSDHAFALLLTLERNIDQLDAAVRTGRWRHDPSDVERVRAPLRRLNTLTLGVVGLGRIGQALVRKARATYGLILASDPVVSGAAAADLGAELVPFPQLLASADHLSLHAPLTDGTRDLISAKTLHLMRRDAIIVNTSRGGLIDEAALADALQTGQIRAAGLDVCENEPMSSDHPLLRSGRVLVTAHSAASSRTTRVELVERSVNAVRALLTGTLPGSVVNPEVLATAHLRLALRREDR